MEKFIVKREITCDLNMYFNIETDEGIRLTTLSPRMFYTYINENPTWSKADFIDRCYNFARNVNEFIAVEEIKTIVEKFVKSHTKKIKKLAKLERKLNNSKAKIRYVRESTFLIKEFLKYLKTKTKRNLFNKWLLEDYEFEV
jgi:hypothetical protein